MTTTVKIAAFAALLITLLYNFLSFEDSQTQATSTKSLTSVTKPQDLDTPSTLVAQQLEVFQPAINADQSPKPNKKPEFSPPQNVTDEEREAWYLDVGLYFIEGFRGEYESYTDATIVQMIEENNDMKAMIIYAERLQNREGLSKNYEDFLHKMLARGSLKSITLLQAWASTKLESYLESDETERLPKAEYQELLNSYVGRALLAHQLGNEMQLRFSDSKLHQLGINPEDIDLKKAHEYKDALLQWVQESRAQHGWSPLTDSRTEGHKEFDDYMFNHLYYKEMKYDFWWN